MVLENSGTPLQTGHPHHHLDFTPWTGDSAGHASALLTVPPWTVGEIKEILPNLDLGPTWSLNVPRNTRKLLSQE